MKEFELEPGEHVVKECRKHWFLFLSGVLPYAILMVLPFALPKLLLLAPPLQSYTSFFDYHMPLARVGLGVWLLIIWTGAWGSFTRYFLNVWVLTNKRLVDVEQRKYFHREVSSLSLAHVQDVTTNVTGVLSSMLGLGNIEVQTAGASDEFRMQGIPRPEQMRDLILKYASTTESKHTGI